MSRSRERASAPAPVLRAELAVVAALTLLAALLRLYKLGQLPPGIHVDEAFNLLDARAVIAGWRPVFLPDNAGREVLYTYLQAPLLALFGERIAVARAASALAGTLSIPLFWWTSRQLLAAHSALDASGQRRAAWLTAGLTAFSFWHLHFSRFGIRAILFPALVCSLVWAWWRLVGGARGVRKAETEIATSGLRATWRGTLPVALILGLAFYTHPAGRALVVLPAAHAAWLWWRERDPHPIRALGLAFAGGLLIASPLLAFWWRHPESFTSHAEETSILGQGLGALTANLGKVAGMFFLAGDPAPWRNLPGRPILGQLWPIDPAQLPLTLLLAAAFLAGLWQVSRAARAGQSWAALLLCWLAVLLVPTAVTDAAPNFSRAIGILPLPFLLVALGLEGFQARLVTARPGLAEGWHSAALPAAILVLVLAATAGDYFQRFAEHPDTPLAFDDDKVALGNLVRAEREAGAAVYLSPAMADHPTVRFVAGQSVVGFDMSQGLVLPPLEVAEAVYPRLPGIDDTEPFGRWGDYTRFMYPSDLETVQAPGLLGNGTGHAVQLHRLRLGLEGPEKDYRTFGGLRRIDFDSYIELIAVEYPSPPSAPIGRELIPGVELPMHMFWRAKRPTETDLNVSLQLVTGAGEGIVQEDGPPLGGSYPTSRWRPGETIITQTVLRIPDDAPIGPAILRVGWYDWRDGSPLTDEEGNSVTEIARFELVPEVAGSAGP